MVAFDREVMDRDLAGQVLDRMDRRETADASIARLDHTHLIANIKAMNFNEAA